MTYHYYNIQITNGYVDVRQLSRMGNFTVDTLQSPEALSTNGITTSMINEVIRYDDEVRLNEVLEEVLNAFPFPDYGITNYKVWGVDFTENNGIVLRMTVEATKVFTDSETNELRKYLYDALSQDNVNVSLYGSFHADSNLYDYVPTEMYSTGIIITKLGE